MILDFRRAVHPKRAAQEISGDPGSSLDWPSEGPSWAAPTWSPVRMEFGCTNIRERACLRGGFIFATPVIVVRGNGGRVANEETLEMRSGSPGWIGADRIHRTSG